MYQWMPQMASRPVKNNGFQAFRRPADSEFRSRQSKTGKY